MNKMSVIILLVMGLMLCACSESSDGEDVNSSLNQLLENVAEQGEGSDPEGPAVVDYEQMLLNVVGEAYLEGRALLRADDEVIFGENCAVFQVGVNTDERFTTEEWLAVSEDSDVYQYDVALDEWSEFAATSTDSTTATSAALPQDCIYALNEIYSDEFSAEYYDAEDMIKKAVYESEEAINENDGPSMLIGLNEAVPEGYLSDPADALYMPVYNFNSKAEISEHFSAYFTSRYVDDMQINLDYNFFEFEGALYIVRGGMGYGAYSVDFDSLDYSKMQNNQMVINTLFLGEPDGNVHVKFKQEDGSLKIDSDMHILMYDLFNVDRDLESVKVPDFQGFVSGNELPTDSSNFEASGTMQYSYRVKHLGDYYDALPEYVELLTLLGFEMVMDGHEGFYSLEKYEIGYVLTVNAYHMNEEDGVVVEVIMQPSVG